jgi:myo-inositol-1-phosphate synthase
MNEIKSNLQEAIKELPSSVQQVMQLAWAVSGMSDPGQRTLDQYCEMLFNSIQIRDRQMSFLGAKLNEVDRALRSQLNIVVEAAPVEFKPEVTPEKKEEKENNDPSSASK